MDGVREVCGATCLAEGARLGSIFLNVSDSHYDSFPGLRRSTRFSWVLSLVQGAKVELIYHYYKKLGTEEQYMKSLTTSPIATLFPGLNRNSTVFSWLFSLVLGGKVR